MKIHVCLVSAQAAANLLPALDPALKPEKVILVVSQKMKQQAKNIATVLCNVGAKVDYLTLSDEHDFSLTEAELLELASQHDSDDTALNITGGTKLMSLAAQSVATAAGWKMFYVDADTDQITWLSKEGAPPHALTKHLRLRHYLQGYGYTLPEELLQPQYSRRQQSLMDTLVRQIGNLENPLAQLNWLAQQAEDKNSLSIGMDEKQQDSRGLEALLRHFADAGSLNVQGTNIIFSSDSDRDFVKGGWLEGYVFLALAAQSNELGIRDKAANLEVDRGGVKNELDITFMARNRLFIIECKTARMDKPEAPKANDTLFKLAENSRRIGGLGTHAMLASYRALRESEKRLAQALNIELVCGADLIRIGEKLKAWVR